jgi:hypothetical protein
MNKKRPIPEVVDEKKFIQNLWNRSLFIDPQPLV